MHGERYRLRLPGGSPRVRSDPELRLLALPLLSDESLPFGGIVVESLNRPELLHVRLRLVAQTVEHVVEGRGNVPQEIALPELEVEAPLASSHPIPTFFGAVEGSGNLVAHVNGDDQEDHKAEGDHEGNRKREQGRGRDQREEPRPGHKIVELPQVALIEEIQHEGEENGVREPDGKERPDEPVLKRWVDDVPALVERRASRGGVVHGNLRQSKEGSRKPPGRKADV